MMGTRVDRDPERVASGGRLGPIGQIYLLLGRCFSYPDEGLYEAMKGPQAQEELRILAERLPFEVDFKGIPPFSLPQEEVESEYINRFDIGLGPSPPCSLYEYEYRKGELTRRDILEELLRFHEHFDIQLRATERDYPDHLVAELEFMAFLAQKEADAVERGKDPDPYRLAQRDFLERRLTPWVERLDRRIRKKVRDPFYTGASAFMVEFLRNHLFYLKEWDEKRQVFGKEGVPV